MQGFSQLELLLIVGVIAIASVGVFATYSVVDSKRKQANEARNVQQLANTLNTELMSGGKYAVARLNRESAKRDGFFPASMLDAFGEPRAVWGGQVLLSRVNVNGIAGGAAALVYEDVPSSACVGFVSDAHSGFYGISVDEWVIVENHSPLDPSLLAQACSSGEFLRVQFTHSLHRPDMLGITPESPPACVVPLSVLSSVINAECPAGELGTRAYRTDYTCPTPSGMPMESAPVLASDNCTATCVLPANSIQSNAEFRQGTRVDMCPVGFLGSTTYTRDETRTQTRHAVCAPSPGFTAPVGPHQWGEWSQWSAWIDISAWTLASSTCSKFKK